VCVYIFCPCSCVKCPQLKSIYCRTVRLVVFRLPEYLYGIFNLQLPPMYAIVIIPPCFVSCMFVYKFHFLCARLQQLDCFQMPTLRFQRWFFFYTDLFHEFVAFIYTIVITFYYFNLCLYISTFMVQMCTWYTFCPCSCVRKRRMSKWDGAFCRY
jgi:hypothetical protein